MLQFITDTIAGGWNAVENVVGGVVQAGSGLVSSFFPANQKQVTRTQIMEPAVTSGLGYQVTTPDAPSLRETAEWSYKNWFDSPYESRFSNPILNPVPSVPVSPAPVYAPKLQTVAIDTAPTIATMGPPTEAFVEEGPPAPTFWDRLFSPVGTAAEKIVMTAEETAVKWTEGLSDSLLEKWGITPKSQTVNSKGAIEYQVLDKPSSAASTTPASTQEQPQGLFSLAFPQLYDYPTPAVATTEQQKASLNGFLVIAGIALLYFLTKK